MSNIEQKIREAIAETLMVEDENISNDTLFVDLGADSLDVMDIVLSVEEAFAITIDDSLAEVVHTVGELTVLVEKVLEHTSGNKPDLMADKPMAIPASPDDSRNGLEPQIAEWLKTNTPSYYVQPNIQRVGEGYDHFGWQVYLPPGARDSFQFRFAELIENET